MDSFEKIFIGNLELKTSTQNNNNSILRKKNITQLVQDNRKLVEKKEKEKVLKIQVSTRNCIICNTYKI